MTVSKPHILMVGPALDVRGGISTLVCELLENGLRDHANVEYVASMVDGSKPRKAVQAALAMANFRRRLGRCDLVHIHISKGTSFYRKRLFARAAQSRGVPFILHEHDGEFRDAFEGGGERYRAQVRELFSAAAKVVVLSEEWRDYFVENVCKADKVTVLHNAVRLPELPCSPCSHQDVLFLGRLDARKSPDVLLRASKDMLEAHPDAKLVFGGDGYPERYERLACELGIANRCEFLGWLTGGEKERLFAQAGVYCLPSKNEGLPMSVLEAMAHGIPVVATPVGGIPQVIRDGVDGYLVGVDDVEALSAALLCLAQNPGRRAEMGAAARRKIEREFGIDAAVKRLAAIYDTCLGA